MSVLVKALPIMLVAISAAVVANGFITGAWFGGLLYAFVAVCALYEWGYLRRGSDETRDAVDRMFVAVFVLMTLHARAALDSLESLIFG